jgi:hypothetical protein
VRGIFPLEFIPGFSEATNFDICCGPQAAATTLVEVVRWVLQMIITLATISVTPQSICYWSQEILVRRKMEILNQIRYGNRIQI